MTRASTPSGRHGGSGRRGGRARHPRQHPLTGHPAVPRDTDVNAPPGHVHVSERQTGKWYDCLWMSAVEWLRMVRDPSIPATHAEGDALRAASGDLGPSTFGNLAAGVQLRYGWTLPKLIPAADLWIALEPGHAAVVSGGLTAWPAGPHRRRRAPAATPHPAAPAAPGRRPPSSSRSAGGAGWSS